LSPILKADSYCPPGSLQSLEGDPNKKNCWTRVHNGSIRIHNPTLFSYQSQVLLTFYSQFTHIILFIYIFLRYQSLLTFNFYSLSTHFHSPFIQISLSFALDLLIFWWVDFCKDNRTFHDFANCSRELHTFATGGFYEGLRVH
jgi:hypothetical protein